MSRKSVFTREMIEQVVEEEWGHTFIHWREELDQLFREEAQRLVDSDLLDLDY